MEAHTELRRQLTEAAARAGLLDMKLLSQVDLKLRPQEAVQDLVQRFPTQFRQSVRDLPAADYRAAKADLLKQRWRQGIYDRDATDARRIGVKS